MSAVRCDEHSDRCKFKNIYRSADSVSTEKDQDQLNRIELILCFPAVDVNQCDKQGKTAIYTNAERGCTQAVNLLLRSPRLDVHMRAHNGRTPLSQATVNKNMEVVEALLNDGRNLKDEVEEALIEATARQYAQIANILRKSLRRTRFQDKRK